MCSNYFLSAKFLAVVLAFSEGLDLRGMGPPKRRVNKIYAQSKRSSFSVAGFLVFDQPITIGLIYWSMMMSEA